MARTEHMSASELSKTGAFTGTAAVAIVAAMIGVTFAGSTLVTPLYIVYEQAFGFSKITLTLIYAAYVIGNLAALLLFGRLSDQMGRRFAALPGLVICAAGAASFLFAQGVVELYAGRILTGLGVGIAAASGTAWLAELIGRDKARATTIATGANFLGIALSPLVAGLLADFTPWPLSLPFLLYIVLVVVIALLTWRTRETVVRPVAARLSLLPRIAVPGAIRARFIAPALAGFGAMALIGFYAALAPSLLAENLHLKSHALAGALVCELGLMVAGAIVLTRNVASRTAMLWALGLMIPSVAAVGTAQAFASIAAMLAGTALCGAAAGLGYRGSLQVVNEIAPAERRAEVLAAYFICCFTGNAMPVIGVGVITVFAGALTATASFAVLITLFAIAAFAFALRYR
jgi:MFS family permease